MSPNLGTFAKLLNWFMWLKNLLSQNSSSLDLHRLKTVWKEPSCSSILKIKINFFSRSTPTAIPTIRSKVNSSVTEDMLRSRFIFLLYHVVLIFPLCLVMSWFCFGFFVLFSFFSVCFVMLFLLSVFLSFMFYSSCFDFIFNPYLRRISNIFL